MAKQSEQNSASIMHQPGIDTLAGPIGYKIDCDNPEHAHTSDSYDHDLSSHINYYLQQLPGNLDLCALSQLSIEDPKAALTIINTLRENVDRELQKARRLQNLYYTTASVY